MKKIFAIGCLALALAAPCALSAQKSGKSAKTPKTTKTTTVKKSGKDAVVDSLNLMLKKAEEGDAKTQTIVGNWYYRGQHVDQDYKKAMYWWRKAAEKDEPVAIGNIGVLYADGKGVEKDEDRARKYMVKSIKLGNKALLAKREKMAEEADPLSCRLIYQVYKNGIGVQKDAAKAVEAMSRIAEKADAETQCLLGTDCLQLGLKNPKMNKEAVKWFQLSAKQGNPAANYYLGIACLEGKGTAKDKDRGITYLQRAADDGNAAALNALGNCYNNGDGVVRDRAQAVKYYGLAAAANSPRAQVAYARALAEGDGLAPNYPAASVWFSRAVDNKLSRTFKNIVNDSIPESGYVTYLRAMKALNAKDGVAALDQCKVLAKTDKVQAKTLEGIIYCTPGLSVTDEKKGEKALKEAAKKGDPNAEYALGNLYLKRVDDSAYAKNRDKLLAEALQLIGKSATAGNCQAQLLMAELYFEGRLLPQDYATALSFYDAAFAQTPIDKETRRHYASILDQGMGEVPADKEKAKKIAADKRKTTETDLLKLL